MTSENDVFMYFHQKAGRGATLQTPPPPSAQFYCYYRPPEGGRSPARLWSTVWHSANQNTNRFSVLGCGECRVRWDLGQVCPLALSKGTMSTAPICASSETGRLYSTVTHHTHNILHLPGSLYLDYIGPSLLVRK